MSVKSILRSGLQGAKDGIHAGKQVVSGAKKVDAMMGAANNAAIQRRVQAAQRGVPPPAQGRFDRTGVAGYAVAKTAHAMGKYYARNMPRNAGGPRTAAYYAYRYGVGGNAAAASGTTGQRDLLSQVRQHHASVNRMRNSVGRYRDMAAPVAQDFIGEYASDENFRRRASALV